MLEYLHGLAMVGERELRLGLDDPRGRAAREEIGDHGLIESGGIDTGEGVASPLLERAIDERARVRGITACGRLSRGRDRLVEPKDVDLFRVYGKDVAGSARLQSSVAFGEDLPELRDLDLEAGPSRWSRLIAPQRFHEGVGRNDRARVERQQREQRPAFPAPQRRRVAVAIHSDRAEQAYIEASRHRLPLRRRSRSV